MAHSRVPSGGCVAAGSSVAVIAVPSAAVPLPVRCRHERVVPAPRGAAAGGGGRWVSGCGRSGAVYTQNKRDTSARTVAVIPKRGGCSHEPTQSTQAISYHGCSSPSCTAHETGNTIPNPKRRALHPAPAEGKRLWQFLTSAVRARSALTTALREHSHRRGSSMCHQHHSKRSVARSLTRQGAMRGRPHKQGRHMAAWRTPLRLRPPPALPARRRASLQPCRHACACAWGMMTTASAHHRKPFAPTIPCSSRSGKGYPAGGLSLLSHSWGYEGHESLLSPCCWPTRDGAALPATTPPLRCVKANSRSFSVQFSYNKERDTQPRKYVWGGGRRWQRKQVDG